MSYSTVAMVRMALVPSSDGQLPSAPTGTAADLTDTQLQDSISEADSLIDGYIGRFYAVPVALDNSGMIPHPIDYFSRNIAAYSATLAYRGSMDFADTDPVARRYTDTLSVLKQIAAGTVGLQLPQNVSDNAATGAGAPFNPYVGDMWQPGDFDLSPAYFDPTWGPAPYWNGSRW